MKSSGSFQEALHLFKEHDVDFILVQDFPDAVKGVLKRETLMAAEPIERVSANPLTVLNFVDRQVCIEPESATVREVLARMTKGFSPCMLIVDTCGRPVTLVSPRSLVLALSENLVGASLSLAARQIRSARCA